MMIQRLLNATEVATGIKPLPSIIKGDRGVAYDWKVMSDDGQVVTASYQLRVISRDKMEIENINQKIKKALIAFGDGSPVPGVTSAFINGQSSLPIGELNQSITNYQIKYRSE